MLELSCGLQGDHLTRAYAQVDETVDDTVVTHWRLVNDTNAAVSFNAKRGDESVTYWGQVVPANDEMLLTTAETTDGVVIWNEGEEHRDGFHSVFVAGDEPDLEIFFTLS